MSPLLQRWGERPPPARLPWPCCCRWWMPCPPSLPRSNRGAHSTTHPVAVGLTLHPTQQQEGEACPLAPPEAPLAARCRAMAPSTASPWWTTPASTTAHQQGQQQARHLPPTPWVATPCASSTSSSTAGPSCWPLAPAQRQRKPPPLPQGTPLVFAATGPALPAGAGGKHPRGMGGICSLALGGSHHITRPQNRPLFNS